jgi:hypothetical protein
MKRKLVVTDSEEQFLKLTDNLNSMPGFTCQVMAGLNEPEIMQLVNRNYLGLLSINAVLIDLRNMSKSTGLDFIRMFAQMGIKNQTTRVFGFLLSSIDECDLKWFTVSRIELVTVDQITSNGVS